MSQPVDPALLELLRKAREDLPKFAETYLKIRTKSGAIEPLVFNSAQLILHAAIERQKLETGRVRVLVVKGRQQGISTYMAARYYHRSSLHFGLRVAVMTHEQDTTDALFAIVNRYHDHNHPGLKPATKAASAKELSFADLDSGYIVATAGNKAAALGQTIQLFHGSEVAEWKHADDHMSGIGQTVPDLPGTEIVLESTGKGLGNMFHRMTMQAIAGKSEYRLVFIAWYEQLEYRRPVPEGFELTAEEAEYAEKWRLDLEQMAWRRNKIDSDFAGDKDRFGEQYPACVEEAFMAEARETYLDNKDVLAARRYFFGEPPRAPLILGVDPARFGDDRTALCWRQGREVTKMMAKSKLDTMQVAGLVAKIIKEDKPARVFIDVIGIGAGVVDRLHELKFQQVVGVNAAERADDPDRYWNKRAEIWARVKEWLREKPVSIPDHDALAQDLLQPGYSYKSNGALLIESKDDIKKRGAPSPDLADALGLTFAEVVGFDEERPADQESGPLMADAAGGY